MKPLDPRLVRQAAGVRGLLVVSVVLGLVAAAAMIGQAVLLARILAGVIIDGQDLGGVLPPVFALAGVVLIRSAVAWAAEELARRSAAVVITGLRRDLLLKAAALGPRWRSGTNGGQLAVLAGNGLDSLHDYLARYLPQLVLATLVPISMVTYLALTDVTSAVIVAVTLPLVPVFMAMIGWYTARATAEKLTTLSHLAGHFSDVVAGLPTLKVFGRARSQAAAVRRVTDDHRKATMGTLRVAFLSSMVLELLASLSVALVAVSIGLRLVSGHLTLQVGLTVLILAPEAYLPLRALGTQFHAATDGVAAAEQVLDVLDAPVAQTGRRTDVRGAVGIDVRGAVVGRKEGDLPTRGAVGPLDLHVPAGRVTVVTGPSGAGKTTLLHLLAGVLHPSTGSVEITTDTGEMVPLADIDPVHWRRSLAWSGQRPVLRPGSIRDNLEAPGIGGPELRAALVACAADVFVDDLPAGWDTLLGPGGSGLSQGQRQRICLARALLHSRDAAVVLLDEPTTALDTTTELRVLAGLHRALAGRTVVIVSHRSAPLAIADQAVALPAPALPGTPALPNTPAVAAR